MQKYKIHCHRSRVIRKSNMQNGKFTLLIFYEGIECKEDPEILESGIIKSIKRCNAVMTRYSISLLNPCRDNQYDGFVEKELGFITDMLRYDPVGKKYFIWYQGKLYFDLVLCGHSYGGAVVNRLTNMIKTRYRNFAGMPEFCKIKIQVYTFGTIRKRSFNDRGLFHTYMNYMYYNDISALHMIEIKDRAKLNRTLENLMFTGTLYYEHLENDFVWLLEKLKVDLDISQLSPINCIQKAWETNHLMYYNYLKALYVY